MITNTFTEIMWTEKSTFIYCRFLPLSPGDSGVGQNAQIGK